MQKRDFFTFFEQSQTFSRTLPPACCTALQVISARFDELALEATYRCLFDSVTLYDGRSRTAPKLGSFCNDEVLSVTSTGPSMSVVFMSDGSGNTGGFSLSWTIVDNCSSGWRLFCFRVSEKNTITARAAVVLFLLIRSKCLYSQISSKKLVWESRILPQYQLGCNLVRRSREINPGR